MRLQWCDTWWGRSQLAVMTMHHMRTVPSVSQPSGHLQSALPSTFCERTLLYVLLRIETLLHQTSEYLSIWLQSVSFRIHSRLQPTLSYLYESTPTHWSMRYCAWQFTHCVKAPGDKIEKSQLKLPVDNSHNWESKILNQFYFILVATRGKNVKKPVSKF